MVGDIAEGAVVTLVTGGAQMTVARVFDGAEGQTLAECFWYEPPQTGVIGDVRVISIPLPALKVVPHD
ncbi:MAG: DUF2158 domain-containing protein [Pseudomonadota bacterium]